MKKNLFLRLYLIMAAMLSFHSCRQDLPERETYNNSSAFQLTSKRISLNQSKHKAKLLPEIEKAETEFKKLKTNAFGKTVNYGNGVSIDTESVIFIENGPNYHTYTFNVISENTSADAPLENLLLTPLPDGTYKKLLISYNFTEQEKQIINNGGYVNTKGKSTVTDLGNGTLDNIVSKSQSCGYVEAQAYTICSEGVHYHGESNCDADVKSHLITVYLWKCESLDDGSGTSGGGPSLGSGPGEGGGGSPCPDCPTGGGTTPTEPCNGNGVLTGPLDPTTDIGDGTCTGIPTLPNPGLPIKTNPCQKIKAIVTKPQIQDSLIAMKSFAQTSLKKERGFQELKSGTLLNGTVTEDLQVNLGIGTNSLGNIHVHPLKGIAMFSAGDLMTFLHLLRQQDATTIGSAYAGMVSASGTYFINFTGTASDIPPAMTEIQEKAYIAGLVTDYVDFTDLMLQEEEKNRNQQLSNQGLEKLFNYLINTMGLNGKVTLIKEENGNTSTIEFNSDGTPKTPNPC